MEWKGEGSEKRIVMKDDVTVGFLMGVYVRIICITREYRFALVFRFFLVLCGDPRYRERPVLI